MSKVPLLFLIADTGGGHRTAARAVGQALERQYPGRFDPVLCDPLGGPGSAWPLRWIAGLYGPATRRAPWLWGAAYHATNSRPAMGLLRRTLLRLADQPVADAIAAYQPAAIVSFHPLTGMAARGQATRDTPVVTVVTDLASAHLSWRYADADLLIAPPDCTAGPPVTREFWSGPVSIAERGTLRRALGLDEQKFLVLMTGGGEGSGGMARRAAAVLRRFDDVALVAVCGRNRKLKRRLDALAAGYGGRLQVTGFTHDMASLLRCCDVVVTKAGPGTIAEAACCGAPMLLTSHLPGQEAGNTEIVTRSGAGCRARGVRRLLTEIELVRADPARAAAMRAAAARLGRPGAVAVIAGLIADLARIRPDAKAPDAKAQDTKARTWV